MFITHLKIINGTEIIREISFHKGLNLVVDDDTKAGDVSFSGNNVGKTTFLRLIDMCLGGDERDVYADPQNSTHVNGEIEKFLKDNKIIVEIGIMKSCEDTNEPIILRRSFAWANSDAIWQIDELNRSKDTYLSTLKLIVFPTLTNDTPGFRSLISHNIRCDAEKIETVLHTLNKYSTPLDYSNLYTALLGETIHYAISIKRINTEIKNNKIYKRALTAVSDKRQLEKDLKDINLEIERLTHLKETFVANPVLEHDIKKLETVNTRLRATQRALSEINIKLELIKETASKLENEKFSIDIKQLERLYKEAGCYTHVLHRNFEELVAFHNAMMENRSKFISEDIMPLKDIQRKLLDELNHYQVSKRNLQQRVRQSFSFEEMENIQKCLLDLMQRKSSIETKLSQIIGADEMASKLEHVKNRVSSGVDTSKIVASLKLKLESFNTFFSALSLKLCQLPCNFDFKIADTKNYGKIFDFYITDVPISTGKKIALAFCFDLAYIMFADNNNIPCLHFMLNDRKELLDDNILLTINSLISESNSQLILSILNDKLPTSLNTCDNIVLKLSQSDKLFKV